MKQKRSLSQVFLTDAKYIRKIVDCLDIKGRTVLEVGSGSGNLSEHLSQKAKQLICLELDQRFSNLLKKKLSKNSNTQVIGADVLRFPISKIGRKLVVFGNVPYRISSDLIKYFIAQRQYISKAYLTFQKEFVNKLTAKNSEKAYGFIGCYIQYYAKLDKKFDIPKAAFCPSPKVDSSFIEMEFYKSKPYPAIDEQFLFELIQRAFSQRRKKIVNSLSLSKIKSNFAIDIDARAEDISLKDYVYLANKLYSQKSF